LSSYPWYAVRVKARREKTVAASLAGKGYECYLPLYRQMRIRASRKFYSEFPLFAGYLFSRVDLSNRLPLLQTPGVVGLVSTGSLPCPVDEEEIEAIRRILGSALPAGPCPFLQTGERVRIKCGVLAGLEGILTCIKGNYRMVVSVALLQRSVAVELDSDWITLLSSATPRPALSEASSLLTNTGTG
jgi:transcription antitermination factor NusG